MPSGPGNANRSAIVGASSLLGKEVKQVLEDRNFPASDIVLLDESIMAGTITEAGGEATFIQALDEDSFDGVRFAFFCGTALDAERNWLSAQRAGATIIDLTGAVNASGRATAWIPSLARALPPKQGSRTNGSALPTPYFSPSTPVIVACTLAAGLAEFKPRSISALLFPPASERGEAGIEELESQTTHLLSFRPVEQAVFGAQVAFNLSPAGAGGSKPSLAEIRRGIASDTALCLAGRAPVPAIQLVQAPVFYGYTFAAFAEFAMPQPVEQLEAAFANLGVKTAGSNEPAPTNVSVAGESEIHMAQVEPDPSVAGGVWLWGAADNLRLAATNAVRIAEELLGNSRE